MAKFKDKIEATKLHEIATDARSLLIAMEENGNWLITLEKGIESYKSNHTIIEVTAFKLAIHFHVIWYLGEYVCKTLLYSVNELANMIGDCDLENLDCSVRAFPMLG